MGKLTSDLIGQQIKKKQLPEVLPEANVNVTLKGGAWQTEFKRLLQYADIEIIGKGAGTKYVVNEIYDTPIERVHGNTGNIPVNKGQVDKNSLKYKLAETIVEIGPLGFMTKNSYLAEIGFKTKTLKNFNRIFEKVKYHELGTIDKFAFDELTGIETALSRLLNNAIDIIKKGHFPNYEIHEELWVATYDIDLKPSEHYEAEDYEIEFGEDVEKMFKLYKKAISEAKDIVKKKYGKNLVYNLKSKLVKDEYEVLISENEEYEELAYGQISYFYNKIALIPPGEKHTTEMFIDYESIDYSGELEETFSRSIEDISYEFKELFIEHRIENALSYIEKKFDKTHITGGFFSSDTLKDFVEKFINILFIETTEKEEETKAQYEEMVQYAKELYQTTLSESIESQLPF